MEQTERTPEEYARLGRVSFPYIPMWGRMGGATDEEINEQLDYADTYHERIPKSSGLTYINAIEHVLSSYGSIHRITSVGTLEVLKADAAAYGRDDLVQELDERIVMVEAAEGAV